MARLMIVIERGFLESVLGSITASQATPIRRLQAMAEFWAVTGESGLVSVEKSRATSAPVHGLDAAEAAWHAAENM